MPVEVARIAARVVSVVMYRIRRVAAADFAVVERRRGERLYQERGVAPAQVERGLVLVGRVGVIHDNLRLVHIAVDGLASVDLLDCARDLDAVERVEQPLLLEFRVGGFHGIRDRQHIEAANVEHPAIDPAHLRRIAQSRKARVVVSVRNVGYHRDGAAVIAEGNHPRHLESIAILVKPGCVPRTHTGGRHEGALAAVVGNAGRPLGSGGLAQDLAVPVAAHARDEPAEDLVRIADQYAVRANGSRVPGQVMGREDAVVIVVAGLGRQVAPLEDREGSLVEVWSRCW